MENKQNQRRDGTSQRTQMSLNNTSGQPHISERNACADAPANQAAAGNQQKRNFTSRIPVRLRQSRGSIQLQVENAGRILPPQSGSNSGNNGERNRQTSTSSSEISVPTYSSECSASTSRQSSTLGSQEGSWNTKCKTTNSKVKQISGANRPVRSKINALQSAIHPWQADHIKQNLNALIETTKCHSQLMAMLQQCNALTGYEIQDVKLMNHEYKESSYLYERIQTKVKGYEKITKALIDCKQSGAFKILLDGFRKNQISNPLSECNVPINHKDIRMCEIQFQGNVMKFHDLFKNISDDDLETIMMNTSCQYDFIDIFITKTKQFIVAENTADHVPTSYVSRRISNRLKIAPELFTHDCEDVYVLKGLQRHELDILANKLDTLSSRNELLKLTSRFILLEKDVDWEEISKITTKPTHLIRAEEVDSNEFRVPNHIFRRRIPGNNESRYGHETVSWKQDYEYLTNKYEFILEETTENSDALWKFIAAAPEDKKLYESEESFISKIAQKDFPRRVCICDTPGMGKTWLLRSLARRILDLHQEKLVIYIPFGQVMQDVRIADNVGTMNCMDALACILDKVCKSTFSKRVLLKAFENKSLELELFMDALDEVSSKLMISAQSLLKVLSEGNQNIRVWVTSRPHVRRELETTLGVVSYDICPFTKENQLDHVVKCWQNDLREEELDQSRLREIASRCLMSIGSPKNQEKDILGIPLLCFMLAHVHREVARIYSNPERSGYVVDLGTTSVTMLYKAFIDKCFDIQNIPVQNSMMDGGKNLAVKNMKIYHTWWALKYLYPEIESDYAEHHQIDAIEPTEMHYQIGILEVRYGAGEKIVGFVHRTMAEFLASDYFAEVLLSQMNEDNKTSERLRRILAFIEKQVLVGEERNISRLGFERAPTRPNNLKIVRFRNPVIATFISQQLPEDPPVFASLANALLVPINHERFQELLQSSILGQCNYLFRFFTNSIQVLGVTNMRSHVLRLLNNDEPIHAYFETVEPTWFLLCLACCFLNKTEVEEYAKLVPGMFSFVSTKACIHDCYIFSNPLHAVILRGDYKLFQYLLTNLPSNGRSFLHTCIEDTTHLPESLVKERLSMVKLMLTETSQILNSSGGEKQCTHPIVARNVHLDILKYCFQQYALQHQAGRKQKNVFNLIDCTARSVSRSAFYILSEEMFIGCNGHVMRTYRHPSKVVITDVSHGHLGKLQIHLRYFDITKGNFVEAKNENWNFPNIFGSPGEKVENECSDIVADFHLVNTLGDTLLHLIATVVDAETVQYYLWHDQPSMYDAGDYEGNSIYHRTAYVGVGANLLKYLVLMGCRHNDQVDSGSAVLRTESMLNVMKQNKNGDIFLHILPWSSGDVDYNDIADFLIRQGLGDAFRVLNNKGETPLHLALLYMEIRPRTTKLLVGRDPYRLPNSDGKSELVDLSHVHEGGLTILHSAVEGKRSAAYIQLLIMLRNYYFRRECEAGEQKNSPESMLDVMKQNEKGDTFLHSFVRYYNAKDFHGIVECLIEQELFDIFRLANNRGQTPLQMAVYFMEVLPCTLQFLTGARVINHVGTPHNNGRTEHVDLSAVDAHGHTILHSAVMGKRSVKFLHMLIGRINAEGSGIEMQQTRLLSTEDIFKRTADGKTFLHYVPIVYNSEEYHTILELIANEGLLDIFRVTSNDGATPLHTAVNRLELLPKTLQFLTGRCDLKGDPLSSEDISDGYVDMESVDDHGNTILHSALWGKRSVEFILFLLNLKKITFNGVICADLEYTRLEPLLDIMKQDGNGNTFLHVLAQDYDAQQFYTVVEYIIEKDKGNILRVANKNGITPLHQAVYSQDLNPDIFQLLAGYRHACNNGGTGLIDFSAVDINGRTIFHYAVIGKRSIKLLKILINLELSQNTNSADEAGSSSDPRINFTRGNSVGKTFLHLVPEYYSAHQYHQLVEFLVGKGLCGIFNVRDMDGRTPLHSAIGSLDLMRCTFTTLMNANESRNDSLDQSESHSSAVDFKLSDNKRMTLLHVAVAVKRSIELILFLLQLGPNNPETEDVSNILNNSSEFTLDMMKQNDDGNTFLHLLSIYYNAEEYHMIVKYIVEKRDVNIFRVANKKDEIPLHVALYRLDVLPETLMLLRDCCRLSDDRLSHDANSAGLVDMSAFDEGGNTILHRAAYGERSLEIIKILIDLYAGFSTGAGDASVNTELRFNASTAVMRENVVGYTFLDIFVQYYSAKQYHELAEFLIERGLEDVFKVRDRCGRTPLHTAVGLHDLLPETLQVLTGKYVDLNAVDMEGCTILHYAMCGKRNIEFLLRLLHFGLENPGTSRSESTLDIMRQNNDGDTFLHQFPHYYDAAQYSRIVKFIIATGHERIFLIANNNGATPLHHALYSFDVRHDTLQLLINRQNSNHQRNREEANSAMFIDFSAVDKNGNTILHYAVNGKRTPDFIQLLTNLDDLCKGIRGSEGEAIRLNGVLDIRKPNNDGLTFLHVLGDHYTADEYHQIAECLLQKGHLEIFLAQAIDGSTPLLSAICQLDLLPKTFEMFHRYNLRETSNGSDGQGHQLLVKSLQRKMSLEKVKQLVYWGADWRHQTGHDSNVANICASHGLIDHLRYFAQLGCNCNETDNNGDNALQCVIQYASENVIEIVRYLISIEVEKDHVNKEGKTALMYATERDFDEDTLAAVVWLLCNGIDSPTL